MGGVVEFNLQLLTARRYDCELIILEGGLSQSIYNISISCSMTHFLSLFCILQELGSSALVQDYLKENRQCLPYILPLYVYHLNATGPIYADIRYRIDRSVKLLSFLQPDLQPGTQDFPFVERRKASIKEKNTCITSVMKLLKLEHSSLPITFYKSIQAKKDIFW